MLKFGHRYRQRRFLGLILVLIIAWSLVLGGAIAIALNPRSSTSDLKSVDPGIGKYKVGEELYLENCSGCHIPIPPAVLPSETWEKILENPDNHYGVKVEGLIRLTQVLIWEYVSRYSRPLSKNEGRPNYISQSRYFKALHPKVALPDPTTHRSCVECHPNAIKFDYRTLK